MKAYRELSAEIGRSKLLQHSDGGGTQASQAGKIRVRGRRAGSQRSWVDTVAGRDYLTSRKLRNAASDGSYEEVLGLVKKGADATVADNKGRTALHFAACRGDANMVKLLISYGGSVNQRDCNGNTPLHLACCTHHVGVVTALLKAGTDVNAVDLRGVTPLHLALSRLRVIGGSEGEDSPEGIPLTRKKEITQIVEMIREYLQVSHSTRSETEELERLASQLTLSETPKQVDAVQSLLESFTTLSIQKRQET